MEPALKFQNISRLHTEIHKMYTGIGHFWYKPTRCRHLMGLNGASDLIWFSICVSSQDGARSPLNRLGNTSFIFLSLSDSV